VALGDKLVVCVLAIAFHPCESPRHAVIQFLNTLARASQRSVLVRIRREGKRWMYQRQEHEQSDGRLNRPKDAIRPSGLWILAKLATASEHYDAAKEAHIIYVYSQSPHSATQGDGSDYRTVVCGRFQTNILGERPKSFAATRIHAGMNPVARITR
jgi:hypothetical protein